MTPPPTSLHLPLDQLHNVLLVVFFPPIFVIPRSSLAAQQPLSLLAADLVNVDIS
jgi:hypothetical protein